MKWKTTAITLCTSLIMPLAACTSNNTAENHRTDAISGTAVSSNQQRESQNNMQKHSNSIMNLSSGHTNRKNSTAICRKTDEALNELEFTLYKLINNERAIYHAAPLVNTVSLNIAADSKAKEMSEDHSFSHNPGRNESSFSLLKELNVSFISVGENIARGQAAPQDVLKAWMHETDSRKNILHPDFTHAGIAYVANGNYWVLLLTQKKK